MLLLPFALLKNCEGFSLNIDREVRYRTLYSASEVDSISVSPYSIKRLEWRDMVVTIATNKQDTMLHGEYKKKNGKWVYFSRCDLKPETVKIILDRGMLWR